MKKTFVLFSSIAYIFSSCISTRIVSSKAEGVKNDKILTNKRIMLVMQGDERSIAFYNKFAANFAQEVGKTYGISVDYVVLSQISFMSDKDIEKRSQTFKADYVMDFKVGRYESRINDVNDYYNTRVEEKVLNVTLKCLAQDKDVWKAALSIGSIDVRVNKAHVEAAKRLISQLKGDNLI